MTQWMFPSFEPVPVNGHYVPVSPGRAGTEKAEDLTVARPEMASRGQDSSSTSSDQKSNGGSSPPVGSTVLGEGKEKPQNTGNRRKSSRPKWVYEGTQLDKSLHEDDMKMAIFDDAQPEDLSCKMSDADNSITSEVTSKEQDDGDSEALHTDNNNDKNKVSSNAVPSEDADSISAEGFTEKMKQVGDVEVMDWSDSSEHKQKIQKLQKNLTTKSGTSDWEF
ncbi:hypothetical protein LSH36_474g04101 [Paralvinella palmiformis]|uniref:Uncharacterized protein n=1 Tax=Paralvinella palmiformis TaxID=53620 RepID=A0AAD9J9G0_9ANNE|nr:hypothetical protein LSH36_474g04101 [Paralvinella palmiformis]